SAATRVDFDDVDDYRNWSASPPQAQDGTAITHLAGWTRACTVQKVDPANLAAQGDVAADMGARQITVTVTRPDGRTTTLTALRVDTSTFEQAPALDTTYTRWIGVELQVGPELRSRIFSGAAVLNHRPPLLGGDGGGGS
ncbi:MAG: hypothetical protein OER86_02825, partial [Phycisphaerae bacterium]|nr:hypothetical protein [Phycisphaerae bacterium]